MIKKEVKAAAWDENSKLDYKQPHLKSFKLAPNVDGK
jgi:hypothetical protein